MDGTPIHSFIIHNSFYCTLTNIQFCVIALLVTDVKLFMIQGLRGQPNLGSDIPNFLSAART